MLLLLLFALLITGTEVELEDEEAGMVAACSGELRRLARGEPEEEEEEEEDETEREKEDAEGTEAEEDDDDDGEEKTEEDEAGEERGLKEVEDEEMDEEDDEDEDEREEDSNEDVADEDERGDDEEEERSDDDDEETMSVILAKSVEEEPNDCIMVSVSSISFIIHPSLASSFKPSLPTPSLSVSLIPRPLLHFLLLLLLMRER